MRGSVIAPESANSGSSTDGESGYLTMSAIQTRWPRIPIAFSDGKRSACFCEKGGKSRTRYARKDHSAIHRLLRKIIAKARAEHPLPALTAGGAVEANRSVPICSNDTCTNASVISRCSMTIAWCILRMGYGIHHDHPNGDDPRKLFAEYSNVRWRTAMSFSLIPTRGLPAQG